MPNDTDILKTIIQHKQQEVIERQLHTPLSQLKSCPLPRRNFTKALMEKVSQQQAAVIAEIKKASPSQGIIRANFCPESIAKSYALSNAACLSVLTDETFFQGHADYLHMAKQACELPVLRKDFIIDAYQVHESAAIGADCILLIVAALDKRQLHQLHDLAHQLNLDVLVECHNREELDLALELSTPLIGINNRNLKNFTTSLSTSITLAKKVPKDKLVITESGIHCKEDVSQMRKHDIHAFLVGEAFMRQENPGATLNALFS